MARRRTTRTLLDDLAARGITVTLDGSDLELSGPIDELPPSLLEEVRAAKPAIVRALRATSSAGARDRDDGAAPARPAPPRANVGEPEPAADASPVAGAEEGIAAAEVLLAAEELTLTDQLPEPGATRSAATTAAAQGAADGPDPEPNPYRGRILRRIRRRTPVTLA